MLNYPHLCDIDRHVRDRLVEGRVVEGITPVARHVPCFLDQTPITAGATSHERNTAVTFGNVIEALLFVDEGTDIREYDRVTSQGKVYEVKYVREAPGLLLPDHIEVHLGRPEQR